MTHEEAIASHLALAQYHAQRASNAEHSILRRHHRNLADLLSEAANNILHEPMVTKRICAIVIDGGKTT
jgi:hypothetical protein